MENDILIKARRKSIAEKYFKFKPKKKKNEPPPYILYSSLEEEQELYELNKIKKHLQKESKNIRPIISIETLEIDLKENYWIEWWKKSLLGLYQKLWLPINDDSQNYDISFSGDGEILKSITQKSWFTQSQIIPRNGKWSNLTCPSLQFDDIESDLDLKTKMIRIYPNKEQKLKLRKWMGISRLIYNKTIELNKKKKLPSLSFFKVTKYILNKVEKYAKKHNFFDDFKNMNLEAKRQSVNDALKAIKNGILKYGKTKEISNFKFRSKKDPTQNLYIRQDCIGDNKFFVRALKDMKTSQDFIKPQHDSRLIVKKNKQWILCIPFFKDEEEKEEGEANKTGICSLDPGNRTFQTFYSPTMAGKIGDGDKNRLFRLCLRTDKLQSKISKNHGNKKRNMIKAYHRIITRIKNLTSEIHWKTARFLCSNFETIILPKFETQSMITKKSGKNKLHSKTCRQMLTWSHFTFQQRLKSKAKEMKSNVIITTEEYTSKTCPCCGNIHKKLKSQKIFKCPECNITIDRDINGARNVYIRFLTKLKSNDHLRSLRWEMPPNLRATILFLNCNYL
jgi:putative transposase